MAGKSSSKNKKEAAWWQPGLVMFTRLSGWIAVPVIGALFLGRWLDDRYGTEPWLFILTVGSAFLLTSVGIVREAKDAMEKIEEEAQNSKDQDLDNRSIDE